MIIIKKHIVKLLFLISLFLMGIFQYEINSIKKTMKYLSNTKSEHSEMIDLEKSYYIISSKIELIENKVDEIDLSNKKKVDEIDSEIQNINNKYSKIIDIIREIAPEKSLFLRH